MRKMKRIMCSILSLCLAASTWMVTMNTFSDTTTASAASDYGLVDNVQEGQILQCWNWSFNNIKNNMAKIAEQGFSAIQTSPIQGSKESTTEYYSTMKNSWWVYYQPINFNIEKNSYNALGTASEFKAMCTEAEKYGIKVIVDAVLNHTANNNSNNTVSTLVPSDLRNDSSCWHDISRNSWYETRWDITQFCMEGIPDLNTGSSKVQNYAIGFLKECIDAGADGFRFDGAKHIEVPTDFDYASNFWPNVIGSATSYAQSTKGFTPYYYGEILDSAVGSNDKVNAQDALNSYMNYMSVTQSSVSNSIRKAVASGNAKTAARSDFYFDDGTKSRDTKSVLWNESHDTYISGSSSGVSTTNMNKTWALVGSRKNAAGLYMARPSNPSSTMLGAADSTGWANASVQAVNTFKNAFVGQSEYLSDYSNFAMIERGTTGAVIVNTTGTSASVNINAYVLENGTYSDYITGNTFTVANGKISGTMGSTGIAVVQKVVASSSYARSVSPTDELAAAEPQYLGKAFSAVMTNVGVNKRISSTNGKNAVTYTISDGLKQRWIFNRQSDGSYEIKNANYSNCLHVTGASSKNGAVVKTYKDNNNKAQRWFIYKLNGYYVLRSACSTKNVLTVKNGGTANKTALVMNTYTGDDIQLFKITKEVHSKYKNLGTQFTANIYNCNAKKNLSIYNASNIITYPASSSDAQKWVFTRQSDGTYEIKNLKYNKLLSVKNNSGKSGANIELAADTNATGQRWQLCYLGYSRYVLRPTCSSNRVMCIEDSSKESGANVETAKYTGKYATCFEIKIVG